MKKRLFVLIALLLIIVIIVPLAGAEDEKYKIYVINEAIQATEQQSAFVFPHHSSPFEKTTVIKLDTQTGETWMLCELGEIKEGTGKKMLQNYWGWCVLGFPPGFPPKHK